MRFPSLRISENPNARAGYVLPLPAPRNRAVLRSEVDLPADANVAADKARAGPGRVELIQAVAGARIERRLGVEQVQDVRVQRELAANLDGAGQIDIDEPLGVAAHRRRTVGIGHDLGTDAAQTVARNAAIVGTFEIITTGVVHRRGDRSLAVEVQRVLPASTPPR